MKIGRKIPRVIALLAVLLTTLLPTMPAYADTALPDSSPSVVQFNAYRNVLETGDYLLLIYANIPYATLPTTPVTQTYIWRLIDTDNTTELGSTVGYSYHDSGYGYNIYSMYFSAADVTALGIIWNTAYPVRLSGNPAVFTAPPEYNFILNTADYSPTTITAEVSTELASRVVLIATDLNTKWALATAYFLTAEQETGTTLSAYGEVVFRGAIYGLQAMAPTAFSYVILELALDDRTWAGGYSDNLTDQWAGTWVETARAGGATLFTKTYDLTSLMMLAFGCIALAICGVVLTGSPWIGLIDATILLILGARLGVYPLGFLGLLAALGLLYSSARIWGVLRV